MSEITTTYRKLKPVQLSPQQQRFVEEYCLGKTATEAARIAGYSPKRPDVAGAKLLKQPHVAAAVAAKRKTISEKTAIDAAWAQEQLVDTYKAARGRNDLTAAIRALELLGRKLGMFTDRLKLDAPPGSQVQAVVNVSIGK
jgi:phage terminase small subunit